MAFQPRSSSASGSSTPSERRRPAKYSGASISPRSCAQYASSKEKRAASSLAALPAASAHAATARPAQQPHVEDYEVVLHCSARDKHVPGSSIHRTQALARSNF